MNDLKKLVGLDLVKDQALIPTSLADFGYDIFAKYRLELETDNVHSLGKMEVSQVSFQNGRNAGSFNTLYSKNTLEYSSKLSH